MNLLKNVFQINYMNRWGNVRSRTIRFEQFFVYVGTSDHPGKIYLSGFDMMNGRKYFLGTDKILDIRSPVDNSRQETYRSYHDSIIIDSISSIFNPKPTDSEFVDNEGNCLGQPYPDTLEGSDKWEGF